MSTALRRDSLAYLDNARLEVLHRVLMRILCGSGYRVEQRYRLFIVSKLGAGGITLGEHRVILLLQADILDILEPD